MARDKARAKAEAEELGRFRRIIEGADLEDLTAVMASILDDCIDALRIVDAMMGTKCSSIELAAALSAELHRRTGLAVGQRSPMIGRA